MRHYQTTSKKPKRENELPSNWGLDNDYVDESLSNIYRSFPTPTALLESRSPVKNSTWLDYRIQNSPFGQFAPNLDYSSPAVIRKDHRDNNLSSPSKVLQSYADGAAKFSKLFCVSSSMPSSRDSTKHLNICTETASSAQRKSSDAKKLTKVCRFRPSSSMEEFFLESSSQHLRDLADVELQHGEMLLDSALSQQENELLVSRTALSDAITTDGFESSIDVSYVLQHRVVASGRNKKRKRNRADQNMVEHQQKVQWLPAVPSSPVVHMVSSTKEGKRRGRPPALKSKAHNDESLDGPSDKRVQDAAIKPKKKAKSKKKIKKPKVVKNTTRQNVDRSKSGCWTCRLRRKKCPEQKPSCGECLRLKLKCDNSESEKPAYMTDKRLARKKMDEIKDITNTTKKIRMANRCRLKKKSGGKANDQVHIVTQNYHSDDHPDAAHGTQ